jgi:hypothetical protein
MKNACEDLEHVLVARQNSDLLLNQSDELCALRCRSPMRDWLMLRLLRLLPVLAIRLFRSRRELLLENLALRQQLTVLKQRHPQPRFAITDKLFWVMLRRLCLGHQPRGWLPWRSGTLLRSV